LLGKTTGIHPAQKMDGPAFVPGNHKARMVEMGNQQQWRRALAGGLDMNFDITKTVHPNAGMRELGEKICDEAEDVMLMKGSRRAGQE
jgi:hypothetical protein